MNTLKEAFAEAHKAANEAHSPFVIMEREDMANTRIDRYVVEKYYLSPKLRSKSHTVQIAYVNPEQRHVYIDYARLAERYGSEVYKLDTKDLELLE